jgi:hypothetical protein
MGAWGPGSFENDTAMDFAAAAAEAEKIRDHIDAALQFELTEALDADTACTAVAAAECVAAMLGRPAADLPDPLAKKLASLGAPDEALLDKARNSMSFVISHSELAHLWAEAEDHGAFNLAMTGLIDRLNPQIEHKPSKGRKKAPDFNSSPCAFCNKPMGEGEYGMFEFSLDTGPDIPTRIGKWAHLACLNANLHPAHIIQAWKSDPAQIERDAERLLRGEEL